MTGVQTCALPIYAGAAVLHVSAELDEIMELSDRIAVMYRGRLVATLDAAGAEKERVGLIMATGKAGGPDEESAA